MKRFFAILVLCAVALLMSAPFLSAQSESLSQRFILVAEWGTATTVNDSIFQIDVTFPGDQLGAGYLPTQIQVGWLCLDATGRRYRITAINDAGFADADLNVLELADLDSEPTGVGIVYNPSAEDLIHTVVNSNTTISPTLMSRIFIHNMLVLDSLLVNAGSGVDSFYLDGDTLRLETTTENFAVGIGSTGSGLDTFYRSGDSLYIVAGLDTFQVSAIEPDSAVYATLTTLADTAAAIRGDFPVAGTGTVTSVGLALPTSVFDISGSPVTSSGTLTATFDTQANNSVFSGPVSGGPSTPSFRVPGGTDLIAWSGLARANTMLTGEIAFGASTNNVLATNSGFVFRPSTVPNLFMSLSSLTVSAAVRNTLSIGDSRIEVQNDIGRTAGLFMGGSTRSTDANNAIYFASGNIRFMTDYTAPSGGTGVIDFLAGGTGSSQKRLTVTPNTVEVTTGGTGPAALTITGTSAFKTAVGTTAQRPTGAVGMSRWNTTVGYPEWHNGTSWFRTLLLPDATPTNGHYAVYRTVGGWVSEALTVPVGLGGMYGGSGNIANGTTGTVAANGLFRILGNNNTDYIAIRDGTTSGTGYAALYSTRLAYIYGGDSTAIWGSAVQIKNPTTSLAGNLDLFEARANGTNRLRLRAPANLSADRDFILPGADGTNGQAIVTNGSGTLSFATFSDTNIGNTDLTTSASLRTLTVANNSSLIIRGQGLNSAIRISDGTAGEQVSLYSSNEVNVQSADTLTVSTDDGNSLVMIPNEGITATTTNGWNLVLDDANEVITSNFPEVVLGGGVRMVNGSIEADGVVTTNGLVQFNEPSPGTDVINLATPTSFSGTVNLTLPTTTGTLALVSTYPRAEISATATRHYTLTSSATNYTVDTLSSAFLTEFTYSAGVLTYIGTATRRFLINYSLSIATDDSVLLQAGIDKNGAGPLTSTRQAASIGTTTGHAATANISGSGIVGLATSDTVKIVIQSDGAGAPIASVRFASFTLIPID